MEVRQTILFTAAVLAVALLGSCAVTEERIPDGAERCLSLATIERTDVVSDNAILFYLRNGDAYLNTLPRRCPGLAIEDAFMYKTSIGQLCSLDTISLLDDIGFGVSPRISCGLGMFHPVTKDDVKALKDGEDLEL